MMYPEFKWFMGIVEDIDDPLMMGRVRIRIIGYHTDDRTALPIDKLPWSIPILPITSASTSGKGHTPLGVLTGSMVVGFWSDFDQQISLFFGSIPGFIPSLAQEKNAMTFQQPPERAIVANRNDGILKDSKGNPVTDSAGNPIAVSTPSIAGWTLGQTSAQYETGGRGAGTINDYNGSAAGDFGGASYGSYQFASYLPQLLPSGKSRKNANNSPLKIYLSQSQYGSKFDGLIPATGAFDSMWKSVASDPNFATDQHNFVKINNYDVMLSGLKRNGLDLSLFGPAVQDCVFSTSIEYGPNALSVFLTPLKDKAQLTDQDIINLVSDYKYQTVASYFKSSSPDIQDGVKARALSEKQALLKLIK